MTLFTFFIRVMTWIILFLFSEIIIILIRMQKNILQHLIIIFQIMKSIFINL